MIAGLDVFCTASAILETAELIRQLLKWIYDNLRAYQTAGQKLLELSDGFETFQVKWRNWTIDSWGKSKLQSSEFQAYLRYDTQSKVTFRLACPVVLTHHDPCTAMELGELLGLKGNGQEILP